MRLGIFAKTFVRPTLAETLDAVTSRGLDCVQFNFSCAGLPPLPDKIPAETAAHIGGELRKRKLSVAAVSGTFNMIDADVARRKDGLRRLGILAGACAAIGAPMVTLCTGTRDPKDMWRHHPDNDSPEAWRDLLQSMAVALEIADKHDIFLGIEPETANVVSSAKKARRLLDEMKSPRLKIVMDASNLFHPGETARAEEILTKAFDLLGGDIMLAHAKDFRDTGAMEYVAPGKGTLPWACYLKLLRESGFAGSLVMHSLAESEVEQSVAFLRKKMMDAPRNTSEPVAAVFSHDGIQFNYQETGRGVPFFFQHGLSGDVHQTFDIFKPPAGFRMLAFDCRTHGQTRPNGPDEKITIASFADDLLALMDHLKIEQAIIGGISLGAAIALNFTLRYPTRVLAMILQRPAWLDGPRRENVAVYSAMVQHIREHGAEKGLAIFQGTELYKKVLQESPSAAKSLVGQFLHPRAVDLLTALERMPLDAPNHDRAEWRAINAPTLVLANRMDPVHPFEYGETLARGIRGAEFHELTPKSVSLDRHHEEVQRFIGDFLLQHF